MVASLMALLSAVALVFKVLLLGGTFLASFFTFLAFFIWSWGLFTMYVDTEHDETFYEIARSTIRWKAVAAVCFGLPLLVLFHFELVNPVYDVIYLVMFDALGLYIYFCVAGAYQDQAFARYNAIMARQERYFRLAFQLVTADPRAGRLP
ncbi:MAG: hypothetical protein Q4E62_08195 [Sutterellaceae bacterium]|nr:hypothetical protein [Sutterellaceae bacterium]